MRKYLLSLLCVFILSLPCRAAQAEEPLRQIDSDIGKELLLPVYKWSSATAPAKAIIIGVHGMTFYAAAFDQLACSLAQEGYVFYACDLRGFGRWKTEHARFGGDSRIHYTQSKEDLLRILLKIKEKYPGQKVFCLGESLGANIGLWLVSSYPEMIDGAILSAPCFKQEIHPRTRWLIDFARGIRDPRKPLCLEPYITPYLSHDQQLTRACLQDENICREASPVELIKTAITNKESLRSVDKIPAQMPMLVLAGQNDRVFKSTAIKEYVTKFGSKRTAVHILEGRGHLLLEHQAVDNDVANILKEWLGRNLQNEPAAEAAENQACVDAPGSSDLTCVPGSQL